jgi:hypothetical protein
MDFTSATFHVLVCSMGVLHNETAEYSSWRVETRQNSLTITGLYILFSLAESNERSATAGFGSTVRQAETVLVGVKIWARHRVQSAV